MKNIKLNLITGPGTVTGPSFSYRYFLKNSLSTLEPRRDLIFSQLEQLKTVRGMVTSTHGGLTESKISSEMLEKLSLLLRSTVGQSIAPIDYLPGILWESTGTTNLNFKLLINKYISCIESNFSPSETGIVLTHLSDMLGSLEELKSKGFINFTEIDKIPVICDLYPSIFNNNSVSDSDKIHNTPKFYAKIIHWSYNLFVIQ